MEVNLINVEEMPSAVVESQQIEFKPRANMCFESEADAYDFYNAYGGRVGFSIRREYGNKSKIDGKITSRLFVCAKEGKRGKDIRDKFTKMARAETRTGCGARMVIHYKSNAEKYIVSDFVEIHNHPLITEQCTHMMRSQRKITASQAIDVEFAADSGVVVLNAFELMGMQAGGRPSIGYTKLDVQNYIRTRRQSELEFGEKAWLLNYFQTKYCEDPSFLYAVQLDNKEMITNIFWADPRMIIDYGHFGDVVTFDTTYKLTHANRPFALFVGLNHHRETVLFGAALMYDETAESFAWLFDSFLKAMDCPAPKTILTDQDAAMAKALKHVMPNTAHHLCTWHLMQNAQKHLGQVCKNEVDIKSVISTLMYCIEDQEDFLEKWKEMEQKFNVVGNKWLSNLFDLRHRWARSYVKQCWTEGMRTTQLSESINASFKAYVTKQLSLPEFFKHFDRLLYDKRYKETEAEYALLNKLPIIATPCDMLVQAGDTYTKRIFEMFQEEFLAACVTTNIKSKEMDNNGMLVYAVVRNGEKNERRVTKSEDNQLSCSCGKFEMMGILCCHCLKVMKDELLLTELPSRYLLRRWCRNARDGTIDQIIASDGIKDPKLEVSRRYRILCRLLTEISSIASDNDGAFNDLLLNAMMWKKNAQECRIRCSTDKATTSVPAPTVNAVDDVQNSTGVYARGIRTKDRRKGPFRRIKSLLEKRTNAAKRQRQKSTRLRASQLAGGTGSKATPSYIFTNGGEISVDYLSPWIDAEDYAAPPTFANPDWDSPSTPLFGEHITPLSKNTLQY